MPDFKLKSGATLVVSMAAWEDGDALSDAVWECKKSFLQTGLDTALLVEEYIHNQRVKAAVMACAKAATYEGAPINAKLFDDPKLKEQARGDMYEIFAKVMEVNLNPFFVHASSELDTNSTKTA